MDVRAVRHLQIKNVQKKLTTVINFNFYHFLTPAFWANAACIDERGPWKASLLTVLGDRLFQPSANALYLRAKTDAKIPSFSAVLSLSVSLSLFLPFFPFFPSFFLSFSVRVELFPFLFPVTKPLENACVNLKLRSLPNVSNQQK